MPVLAKTTTSGLKRELAALVFFVLAALTFFAFRISQGYVLAPEDDFVQNFPAFACPLRLWTPLLLTGFPLLADPQIQYFYPLAWMARHIPLGADLTANFNLYIISAFVLAAYFAFLLARRLTGSFYAGLMAGLCYGFSGYFVSELKHVQVLHTALWLPLLMLLTENAKDLVGRLSSIDGGEGARRACLILFCTNLFLLSLFVAGTIFAGHPQTAFYVLGTVIAYAIYVAFWLPAAGQRFLFLLPFF